MERKYKLTEEHKRLIREHASEELTCKEIVKLVGARYEHTYQYLHKYNLPFKIQKHSKPKPKVFEMSDFFNVHEMAWL